MSKRQVIMLLGVCIVLLPFLGFPLFWDKIFYVIAGVLIVGIAYKIPSQKIFEITNSNKDNLNAVKDFEISKTAESLPFVDHRRESDSVLTNT